MHWEQREPARQRGVKEHCECWLHTLDMTKRSGGDSMVSSRGVRQGLVLGVLDIPRVPRLGRAQVRRDFYHCILWSSSLIPYARIMIPLSSYGVGRKCAWTGRRPHRLASFHGSHVARCRLRREYARPWIQSSLPREEKFLLTQTFSGL
jgi:hypothetical protein